MHFGVCKARRAKSSQSSLCVSANRICGQCTCTPKCTESNLKYSGWWFVFSFFSSVLFLSGIASNCIVSLFPFDCIVVLLRIRLCIRYSVCAIRSFSLSPNIVVMCYKLNNFIYIPILVFKNIYFCALLLFPRCWCCDVATKLRPKSGCCAVCSSNLLHGVLRVI